MKKFIAAAAVMSAVSAVSMSAFAADCPDFSGNYVEVIKVEAPGDQLVDKEVIFTVEQKGCESLSIKSAETQEELQVIVMDGILRSPGEEDLGLLQSARFTKSSLITTVVGLDVDYEKFDARLKHQQAISTLDADGNIVTVDQELNSKGEVVASSTTIIRRAK